MIVPPAPAPTREFHVCHGPLDTAVAADGDIYFTRNILDRFDPRQYGMETADEVLQNRAEVLQYWHKFRRRNS